MGLTKSFKEYAPKVILRWKTYALGAFVAILLWLTQRSLSAAGANNLPTTLDVILDWAWLVALGATFVVAQFMVFHEARVERDELGDLRDYKSAIDRLSEYFNEGNNAILNDRSIKTPADISAWHLRWQAWQAEVCEFLRNNFGVREENLFKNRVTVRSHLVGGISVQHDFWRNILVEQLESLRGTITRHSERADEWREKMKSR